MAQDRGKETQIDADGQSGKFVLQSLEGCGALEMQGHGNTK
jgi:hypothetical protein